MEGVLVGCENGIVYLLKESEVVPYAKVGCCITAMKCLTIGADEYLFCIGHFNALKGFHKGKVTELPKTKSNIKMITNVKLPEWPNSLEIGDVNNDEKQEIIVGLVNYKIQIYQIS